MSSIFSKIIQGKIPSYKIAENDDFLAFLDAFPLRKGHTLVIPKKGIDNIFDLDTNVYKDLFSFAQEVGIAVQKAIPCKRVGIAVIGLEVPHAHIHLVPIQDVGDLNFAQAKLKLEAIEMESIAKKIRSKIDFNLLNFKY